MGRNDIAIQSNILALTINEFYIDHQLGPYGPLLSGNNLAS
jgi:hypothetical protein